MNNKTVRDEVSGSLQHHGILGQKWGVRRYQNEDGSLTETGRKRYGHDTNNGGLSKSTKAGLKIAGVAAAGAATYLAVKNPDKTKELASKTWKYTSKSAAKAGEAAVNAALVSVGTIAVAEIAKRLPTKGDMSDGQRYTNQVLKDSSSAAIKSLANINNNINNNNNNNSNNIVKEVKNLVGEPTKNYVDKNSDDYRDLFKDLNGDSEKKSKIKQMANAGYDITQLKKYKNS